MSGETTEMRMCEENKTLRLELTNLPILEERDEIKIEITITSPAESDVGHLHGRIEIVGPVQPR